MYINAHIYINDCAYNLKKITCYHLWKFESKLNKFVNNFFYYFFSVQISVQL